MNNNQNSYLIKGNNLNYYNHLTETEYRLLDREYGLNNTKDYIISWIQIFNKLNKNKLYKMIFRWE
jgi:hypothetical protein